MPAGGFSSRMVFSFSVQDLMREQGQSCCSRSGPVDRVRDQENEGSTSSFVYIECDQVRKCIRLPSTPRPHSALSAVPTPFCFPGDRLYTGGGWRESKERDRERGV